MRPSDQLSERELEVLRLAASGLGNKEIARQLQISPNTVKVHLRNIFAKTGAESRAALALYAVRRGLVRTEPIDPPAPPPEAPAAPRDGLRWNDRILVTFIILIGLITLTLLAATVRDVLTPNAIPTSPAATAVQTSLTRWEELAPLPVPRAGAAAVSDESGLYLIGGANATGLSGALFHYLPATNRWEELASKPTPVELAQAAWLGGKIFVPGGRTAGGLPTRALEVYDPLQNAWTQKGPLPAPLSDYALAALEGRLYLFGGWDGINILSSVYIYDPSADTWTTGASLSIPRRMASAAVLNGKIHLAGGQNEIQVLALHQAYTPARDLPGQTPWEDLGALPIPRTDAQLAPLANMLYLAGGSGPDSSHAELPLLLYQPETQTWLPLEYPPQPVGISPAFLPLGTRLHLIGGETAQGHSAQHQVYQAVYTLLIPVAR